MSLEVETGIGGGLIVCLTVEEVGNIIVLPPPAGPLFGFVVAPVAFSSSFP
jgi:hypothetical protein